MLAFSKLNPSWGFWALSLSFQTEREWKESKGGPSAGTVEAQLLSAGLWCSADSSLPEPKKDSVTSLYEWKHVLWFHYYL